MFRIAVLARVISDHGLLCQPEVGLNGGSSIRSNCGQFTFRINKGRAVYNTDRILVKGNESDTWFYFDVRY